MLCHAHTRPNNINEILESFRKNKRISLENLDYVCNYIGPLKIEIAAFENTIKRYYRSNVRDII